MPSAKPLNKPLLRGHFHQAAFFFSLGLSVMLIAKATDSLNILSAVIYSIGLCGLFGVSAVYHRPHWQPVPRARMRWLDHCAIFVLIAGTFTPICLQGLQGSAGHSLLITVWSAAAVGVLQATFWITAPKWLTAVFYVGVGWVVVPYISRLQETIGSSNLWLISIGGIVYTCGAIVYAVKRPNPNPRVFGYHEIFHALVIVAALVHFVVVNRLLH